MLGRRPRGKREAQPWAPRRRERDRRPEDELGIERILVPQTADLRLNFRSRLVRKGTETFGQCLVEGLGEEGRLDELRRRSFHAEERGGSGDPELKDVVAHGSLTPR